MGVHSYDTYTKQKVETFVPQARAGIVFAHVNRSRILDKVGDTEEIDQVIAETLATIDLLLAPSLWEGYSFSDIKAKRYMNYIDSQLESVLTREQISIIRSYPAITIT